MVYASRDGEWSNAVFNAAHFVWDPAAGWSFKEIELPQKSGEFIVLGSGRKQVEDSLSEWRASDVGRTSRAIFSAFCDAIDSRKDPLSGGPPQIVALRTSGPPKSIGIAYKGAIYLQGARLSVLQSEIFPPASPKRMEWTNQLFEICDPHTMQRVGDAQKHAKP